MLLALALSAVGLVWWYGRTGRLPFATTPRGLVAYAAFAVALVLAGRGALLPAGLAALAGLALLEGGVGLGRRVRRARDGLSGWRPRLRAPTILRRTAILEWRLGPDGSPLDGRIAVGAWAGRGFATMPPSDLATLLARCRVDDPEGLALLEAYLDRRYPGRRVDAERDRDTGTGRPLQPGAMTEQEAYQVLGLERGASLEEVRAAHRALMKRLHPDQGGSVEGAARANAARDRLTNRHR